MNKGLIPNRYAKAILEYASERGEAGALYQLMGTLAGAFACGQVLQKAVANPYVSDADKLALLRSAAGVGQDDVPVFEAALRLLSQNGRLDLCRDIAIAYREAYRKANHIRRVSVTSAAPLDAATEERLKGLIQKHLGADTMEYSAGIDPDLIGGFTVKIDNELLDASVANELRQLRQKLISK